MSRYRFEDDDDWTPNRPSSGLCKCDDCNRTPPRNSGDPSPTTKGTR